MKRSKQVSLVLMAAAGVGATAYALAPSGNCRQSAPDTVARDPQQIAAQGASPPDCRSSRGGSSGRSSFFSSGSSSSGTSGATTSNSNSTSTSPSRGGFGAIGHALASFSGGG